jgi:riboflavin synthase
MFTGLVEATGIVASRTPRGPGAYLVVHGGLAGEPLKLGESIAVDGVCLSVVEVLADGFGVDASAETLARTTLGTLAPDQPVNLERALRAGDRLGGHLVTGHVDGVGTVVTRALGPDSLILTFALPKELSRFVAEKGSIAINGVSMTVNAASDAAFEVTVIPLTQQKTNLGTVSLGDRVNLEVDIIARYVARACAP